MRTIKMDAGVGNKTMNEERGKNSSERGAVLIVVVVLSAIALAVATSLLYMITAGTKISGMERRYRTARDASYGSVEVLGQMIFTKQTNTDPSFLNPLNPTYPADTSGCQGTAGASTATGLRAKILTDSSTWTAVCNPVGMINPDVLNSYDFSFDIGTSPVYRVYARIVNTIRGNTMGGYAGQEVGSTLDTHQGVVSMQTELPVENIPFSYLIEIDTRNLSDKNERSRLSVFYHY